jgi:hypothetical protein
MLSGKNLTHVDGICNYLAAQGYAMIARENNKKPVVRHPPRKSPYPGLFSFQASGSGARILIPGGRLLAPALAPLPPQLPATALTTLV